MRRLLITSSLLDSVQWLKTCPPNWKIQAHQDLISTLSRKPYEPNAWCKRGIEFENMLDRYDGENELLCVMRSKISGGLSQQKASKDIKIYDDIFTVYGRCDYLLPQKIIDVKTTYKTKKNTKPKYYKERNQHNVYSYLWGVNEFEYLIAHLGDDTSNIIPFEVSSINIKTNYGEEDMVKSICDFMDTLCSLDLVHMYINVYNGERQ